MHNQQLSFLQDISVTKEDLRIIFGDRVRFDWLTDTMLTRPTRQCWERDAILSTPYAPYTQLDGWMDGPKSRKVVLQKSPTHDWTSRVSNRENLQPKWCLLVAEWRRGQKRTTLLKRQHSICIGTSSDSRKSLLAREDRNTPKSAAHMQPPCAHKNVMSNSSSSDWTSSYRE